MSNTKKEYFESQPFGKLGIISLRSYEKNGKEIDQYISEKTEMSKIAMATKETHILSHTKLHVSVQEKQKAS